MIGSKNMRPRKTQPWPRAYKTTRGCMRPSSATTSDPDPLPRASQHARSRRSRDAQPPLEGRAAVAQGQRRQVAQLELPDCVGRPQRRQHPPKGVAAREARAILGRRARRGPLAPRGPPHADQHEQERRRRDAGPRAAGAPEGADARPRRRWRPTGQTGKGKARAHSGVGDADDQRKAPAAAGGPALLPRRAVLLLDVALEERLRQVVGHRAAAPG